MVNNPSIGTKYKLLRTFKDRDTCVLQPRSGRSHFADFKEGTVVTVLHVDSHVEEDYGRMVLLDVNGKQFLGFENDLEVL